MPTNSQSPAPTSTGEASGRDSSGTAWAFESPADHWAAHDVRQHAYWLTRSPEARLAQAAEYRRRVHGDVEEPASWTWRFLGAGEQ